MSEENLEHAFSPFYTTKSKGFGLGLFVVKHLVMRNKGDISVRSKPGEGTAFTLTLPRNLL
jgi:signal transduction histidine kinase